MVEHWPITPVEGNQKIQQANEFSLSQILILGGSFGEHLNNIDAGWQINPDLYGDNNTRIFTYWTSDAYQATSYYSLLRSGFIQINNNIAMGASISPVCRVVNRFGFRVISDLERYVCRMVHNCCAMVFYSYDEGTKLAYLFRDYWEDIGTIKSFYDANLSLTDEIKNAIISHGCFLGECSIEHSIVGERSRLDSGVELKDTLMLGGDYYQTESEIAYLLADGKVPIGVGSNSKIRNCIIDKNTKIGSNVMIINKDGVEEADRADEGFYIRSGITIILEKATINDDVVI